MNQFIIMKSSRAYDNPTPYNAYSNPQTCEEAGVERGKVYLNRDEAEQDALKLGKANPVGFTVVELRDYKLQLP